MTQLYTTENCSRVFITQNRPNTTFSIKGYTFRNFFNYPQNKNFRSLFKFNNMVLFIVHILFETVFNLSHCVLNKKHTYGGKLLNIFV